MKGRDEEQSIAELYEILKGCLNQHTIQQSTEMLMKKGIQEPYFVSQLCYLIPNADENTLKMIMTTLKNFLLARYNNINNPIPAHQKQFLRDNLFVIFYQIYPQSAPIKILKEIFYIIIAVSYPWQFLNEMIEQDLNSSIIASIYFFRQVAKANEWFHGPERLSLEQFINQFFPKIEVIMQKIFQNYHAETGQLLFEAFKTFYSAIHIQIPGYFRDHSNTQKWLMYLETILNVPSDPISLKSQYIAARSYLKLFALFCNETQDDKDNREWSIQFRQRFAQRIFQHTVNLIGQRKGNEDILSTLINCLYEVVKWPFLRYLFTSQHCEVLFYGNCLLPLCQSDNNQLNLFKNDGIQYVRRLDDLTCYPIRRSILYLIEMASSCLSFPFKQEMKSQMIRIVEYSASVLQSQAPDAEKVVILKVLSKTGTQILKNNYLKSQFQNLTIQFFIPLLKNSNPVLNAEVCGLLSLYLPEGQLDNQTVNQLMELIYEKIVSNNLLVVKFHALLAFTALLNHRAALEAALPHFKNILEIYVSILNTFDHEDLIGCLESIVKHFSTEIISYAPDLISHLLRLFVSLCKNDNQEQDEDEPDPNSPATASLSTIKQILSCQLPSQTYFNISQDFIQLLRGIFDQYQNFFDQILSLFNVLVHKANQIIDFQYPYVACRKLLQGDNGILSSCRFPNDVIEELAKAEKADSEFEESLVSILKNLIQKMPLDIFLKYPYPLHPQLILCIIENKKIRQEQLFHLNTNQVDEIWTHYISSYTLMLYGVGSLANPQVLHPIVGVSLQPWLKAGITPQLVKLVVNSVQAEQEQEDDMYEQNTAQMLQKYANEDDDESEDFCEGSGINYGYLYQSPFDSSKDKDLLIQTIKSLPQTDAQNLANSLSNRYRKKLQSLFN